MPYIKGEDRSKFDGILVKLQSMDLTPGEINYFITSFLHNIFLDSTILTYTRINSLIGVLECAKLELYRQVAARYEDKKKLENGSISVLDDTSMEDVR